MSLTVGVEGDKKGCACPRVPVHNCRTVGGGGLPIPGCLLLRPLMLTCSCCLASSAPLLGGAPTQPLHTSHPPPPSLARSFAPGTDRLAGLPTIPSKTHAIPVLEVRRSVNI